MRPDLPDNLSYLVLLYCIISTRMDAYPVCFYGQMVLRTLSTSNVKGSPRVTPFALRKSMKLTTTFYGSLPHTGSKPSAHFEA
ncbi:MAG: hypothetical protein ACE5Z5_06845 [Candidatus Bathyarchaeia archaeon]